MNEGQLYLGENQVTIINMPGLCHGPEKYARSPIHDRVVEFLRSDNPNLDIRFIPSADVRQQKGDLVGIQLPISRQLERLREVVEDVISNGFIPVALVHCTGALATIEALRDGNLPHAVFVSPVFLNPIREVLDSRVFKRRFITTGLNSHYCGVMSPKHMSYPTFFPHDHFKDRLYMEPVTSEEKQIAEVIGLIREKAKIFIEEYDWNEYAQTYADYFPVEAVEGEKHSFELNMQSAKKISVAIADLFMT